MECAISATALVKERKKDLRLFGSREVPRQSVRSFAVLTHRQIYRKGTISKDHFWKQEDSCPMGRKAWGTCRLQRLFGIASWRVGYPYKTCNGNPRAFLDERIQRLEDISSEWDDYDAHWGWFGLRILYDRMVILLDKLSRKPSSVDKLDRHPAQILRNEANSNFGWSHSETGGYWLRMERNLLFKELVEYKSQHSEWLVPKSSNPWALG